MIDPATNDASSTTSLKSSVYVNELASPVPLFFNVIVYVTVCPALAGAGAEVLVTCTLGPLVTTDDVHEGEHPESVDPEPGVTVAELVWFPDVEAGTVPLIVYVIVPPGATLGLSEMFPLPDAAPHELPLEAAQFHPKLENPAGSVSVTVGSAVDGPAFLTVTVYEKVSPGWYEVEDPTLDTVSPVLGAVTCGDAGGDVLFPGVWSGVVEVEVAVLATSDPFPV